MPYRTSIGNSNSSYLENAADRSALLAGIKKLRELARQSAFENMGNEDTLPGPTVVAYLTIANVRFRNVGCADLAIRGSHSLVDEVTLANDNAT